MWGEKGELVWEEEGEIGVCFWYPPILNVD